MTWYPIALLPPQIFTATPVPYSGAVLKAYAAGTSTPIPMATDVSGATVTAQMVLNASGYPTYNSTIVIPHLQEDYKLALYPDLAAANANSGAIWMIDNIPLAPATNTPFIQYFDGDGVNATFTLSSDLGNDETILMVFSDRAIQSYATNTDFATDSVWTKGAGWTIGSGVATATGAINTEIQQNATAPLVQGQTYTVEFTVTASAGTLTPSVGGNAGTTRGAGTWRENIVCGSTQVIAFTGVGFTGTLDNASVKETGVARRFINRPDEMTLVGNQLTLNNVPPTGTKNVIVFAPSLLLGAANNAAAAAATSELNAFNSATLAMEWATLTTGQVASTDYSAKAYAIGGTGVTSLIGAAKEWATTVGAAVIAGAYSAKEWAIGTFTRGSAGGGSAKDWANYTGGTVDDTEYSAKHYANNSATSAASANASDISAAASAAAAAAAAAGGLYNNVDALTFANSPFVPLLSKDGNLWRVDTSGGNVVINLGSLATYNQDIQYAFVKVTADANTITINRGGTDTINGNTSLVITNQFEPHALIGDLQTGTWLDTVQQAGIADGSVTNAKLTDMSNARIKARITAGTGDPEDATITQVLDLVTGTPAQGDILYRGASAMARLAPSTSGLPLVTKGAGANPAFEALGVSAGGTGLTSFAAGDILYASGATTLTKLAKGTALQTLRMNSGATAPEWATTSALNLATMQAATSGSSINFTGIPAGTKRIIMSLQEVSMSGTSSLRVQIGDSGGLETTGYVSASGTAGVASITDTSGFAFRSSAANVNWSGHIILTLMDASTNLWACSQNLITSGAGGTFFQYGAGIKALSATLDRISILSAGADTFDNGNVNIMYEG